MHLFLIICFIIVPNCPVLSQDSLSVIWNLNRTDSIGGFAAAPLNEYPSVVSAIQGDALQFDGINDALFIKSNPLDGASSFTVEIIFKPDSSSNPDNIEQRYIHIRSRENDTRRILLELRLTADQKWFLDTYIRSEINGLTLIDSNLTHETGKWYHVALTYDNGTMRHYVNGIEEARGEVAYVPIEKGQMSIGVRQGPRCWFKGTIQLIKFTRRALQPEEFLSVTTNIEGKTSLSNDYFLCQNYPNPFNPFTSIRFRIKSPEFVTINIYDIFGGKIATLCSEEKNPETYTVVWNGKDEKGYSVSSGVYFYQIRTPEFSQIRKMMLLR